MNRAMTFYLALTLTASSLFFRGTDVIVDTEVSLNEEQSRRVRVLEGASQ